MTKLSDTYYLNRAGKYPDPLNSNARLPVIYGNIEDGDNGAWVLPRIDDVVGVPNSPVYCYAAHETLSIANGNTVTVYEDGQELTGGGVNYTFDEADNYDGLGVISTINMITPKDNAIITATGSGKPTTAAGATLMENIVDIVNDFLTVENDFTSALYESTAKATAASIFTGQSYKAAGAIIQDVSIWDTIIKMMGSFLGSVYVNGEGELVLDIDINTIPTGGIDIISKGDAYLSEAKLKRDNIINQCPCNYAYDYVLGRFRSHTDASAHLDASSQGVFGVRTPKTPYQFYWCRDLTSVQLVQDYIVAKLKDPIYEIGVTAATLKQAALDIGDFFAYSVDSLYDKYGMELLNQIWKIISVKPNYAKNRIVFRAHQTAYNIIIAYLAGGGYIAESGLVGHWKFDDSAIDGSGNGNDGTLVGAPSYETGEVGKCLEFNGSEAVNCGSGASLDLAGADTTVTAWIYRTVADANHTIYTSRNIDEGNAGFQFRINSSNKIQILRSFVGSIGSSNTDISAAGWFHVAATYDSSGNYEFFRNSVSDGSGTNLLAITDGTSLIGAEQVIGITEGFDGKIDEVKIYNRVLSQTEITLLYETPIYNYTHLADGSITAGNNRDTTVY